MGFELSTSTTAGVNVLSVAGDIDIETSEQVRQLLLETLERGSSPVVVDLSEVTFLDSTGLGALASGLDRADGIGAEIIVVSPPQLRRLFKITGLDAALRIVDDLDSALPGSGHAS